MWMVRFLFVCGGEVVLCYPRNYVSDAMTSIDLGSGQRVRPRIGIGIEAG